jgi:Cdc6-like AAA superfamily ATPase
MTHIALNAKTRLPLRYMNRHGLITGQTGTGKTVSLQRLTEQFSKAGVPVFVSDVKGDIAALSRSCPTQFLDVFGQTGKPLTVSISSMGAELIARALELTDTQAGVLEIAFAVARDKEWPLDTIANLRTTLALCVEYQTEVSARYGQVSKASVGVIMRALLRLESQGGNAFFSQSQFDVAALLEVIGDIGTPFSIANDMRASWHSATETRGLVSILQAERLINSPRVYAAFLLWLLTELWDRLPEIGDIDKPRLVLFFDEAHLLFSEINPALLRRIEQTVRLIRSKGVGVYFVTQSPDDVPPAIREQLAFQITHERAYRIGQANVAGLNDRGGPVNHGLVQIDLPECPLGALADSELPVVAEPEATSPQPVAGQWARMGRPEILLLLVILVAIGLGAWGLIWLFNAGTIGKVASVGIALAIAAALKA